MPLTKDLTKFTTTPSEVLSVSFTELVTGQGIITLKGFKGTDSTGEYAGATSENWYADPVLTAASQSNASFQNKATINFDSGGLEKSVRIGGKCTIQASFQADTAAGTTDVDVYIIFIIQHYDGTTATTLGTVQTETLNSAGGTDTTATALLQVDLTEKTFKKGDIIRTQAQLWAKANAGSGNVILAHDPSNKDDPSGRFVAATNPTNLLINIPIIL